MMEQYSTLPSLLKRWDKVGRQLAFQGQTPEEVSQWQGNARQKLKQLLGYNNMTPTDPNPVEFDSTHHGDYTLHHAVIYTEPEVGLPFYILEPDNRRKPYMPIIACHGHESSGKVAVAGVATNEEIAQTIENYNYAYGRALCKAGFIVFCPDARGFGERKERLADENSLSGSCFEINKMAIPLGQTVAGMWTWDIHRLIDYIAMRDDCDCTQLACVGLSGGGYQTLLASALDERIQSAVVSGYFYGFKQALLEMYENCSCNYVPHLWEHFDACDIGALIAPRRLFIETGDVDELNGREGLTNVYSQVKQTSRAYEVLGAMYHLKHVVHAGGHKWFGDGVVEWLRQT